MVSYDEGKVYSVMDLINAMDGKGRKMQDMCIFGLYYIVHIESGGLERERRWKACENLPKRTWYLTLPLTSIDIEACKVRAIK